MSLNLPFMPDVNRATPKMQPNTMKFNDKMISAISNPRYRFTNNSLVFTHANPSIYFCVDMSKSRTRELVRASEKFDKAHIKQFVGCEEYNLMHGVVEGWGGCTSCKSKCDYCVANMPPMALRELYYEHTCPLDRKALRDRARRRMFDAVKSKCPTDLQDVSLAEISACPVIELIDPVLKEAVIERPKVLPKETRDSYIKFCERMVELYKPISDRVEKQGNGLSMPVEHTIDSTSIRDDLQSFSQEFFRQAKEMVEGVQIPAVKVNATLGFSTFAVDSAKKIGAACFLIFAVYRRDMALIGVATVIAGMVFLPEQMSKISETVSEYLHINKEGFSPSLSSLLGCFVLSDAVKRATGSHNNFLSSFANDGIFFERRTKGLADMIDFLLDLVQRGLDALWKAMSGVPCPIRIIDKDLQDAYGLIKKILDVESSRNAGNITTSEAFFQLQELNAEVCKIIEQKGAKGSACRVLTPYQSILASALREVQGLLKANGGFRQQPVGLVLIGAPGIGKSFLSTTFAAIFAEKFASKHTRDEMVKDPITVGRNIYQWDASSQYYSGYTGQTVFFIDEASTKPLVPTAVPFPVAVINMINTIPMSLNMAELSNKGNTFFCSKAILATTNKRNWADLGDISNEAVYRRLNFVSVVVAKKEYAINPDAAQEEWMLNGVGKDHYREITDKFNKGEMKTLDYIDAVYSILEFKMINMSLCKGHVNHVAQGDILRPSQLLHAIMAQEQMNRLAMGTTKGIISRIIHEQPRVVPPVPGGFERQGGEIDTGDFGSKPTINDDTIRFFSRMALNTRIPKWIMPFFSHDQTECVDFQTYSGENFYAKPMNGKYQWTKGSSEAKGKDYLETLNMDVKVCRTSNAVFPHFADPMYFHSQLTSCMSLAGVQCNIRLEDLDPTRPIFDPGCINPASELHCPCCYKYSTPMTLIEIQSLYALHVAYKKRRVLSGALIEVVK